MNATLNVIYVLLALLLLWSMLNLFFPRSSLYGLYSKAHKRWYKNDISYDDLLKYGACHTSRKVFRRLFGASAKVSSYNALLWMNENWPITPGLSFGRTEEETDDAHTRFYEALRAKRAEYQEGNHWPAWELSSADKADIFVKIFHERG